MTKPNTPPDYLRKISDVERHLAILGSGELKGLWSYWALVGDSFVIERNGILESLTGKEVDRLGFDGFTGTLESQLDHDSAGTSGHHQRRSLEYDNVD